jgi:eukaryotic-like serine/threonine-protein kinase
VSESELLGQLAEDFTARVRNGEAPDVEVYAQRHPDCAARIRALFPTLVLIEGLAVGGAASAPAATFVEPVGADGKLGDYRLVRVLGRGGMGVVYEAEQISLRNRRVALKVLTASAMLDPRRRGRFQQEAQAAALLHHAHIVPVYGVGCENGLHYYAMQYIDGPTLAAVIDDLRRAAGRKKELPADAPAARSSEATNAPASEAAADPTPQPLALASTERSSRSADFLRTVAGIGVQAAEAIDYAHQEGVIHRDIKPGNFLLENRGEPHLWLTDFGLARLRDEPGPTLSGDLVGTLRYMSPEQALGQRQIIDHRSDIYGLGATLYELLTLEPVFAGHDRQELLRQIAFDEPRPLRRVNPAVAVELETIVLKALAKTPPERYATAKEMADDLRRFLDNKPILARRPTLRDRASKWLRRHPELAWASVAVLVVAVAALTISAVVLKGERDQAQAERNEARARRRDAIDALNRMLEFAHHRVVEQPHLPESQLAELREGLSTFDAWPPASDHDPEERFGLGAAYRKVGVIYIYLENRPKAEAALRQAIALLTPLTIECPDIAAYRAELAAAYGDFANLLHRAGRLEDAEEALCQCLRMWKQIAVPGAPAWYRRSESFAHHCLAMVRQKHGQWKEAERSFRDGKAILEKLVSEFSDDAEHREALARLYCDMGGLLRNTGQPVEVYLTLFKDAKSTFDGLPASFRSAPARRHLEAVIYKSLGVALSDGDPHEAEKAEDNSIASLNQLVKEYPKVVRYRRDLADVRNNAASRRLNLGRHEQALPELRETQRLLHSLMAEAPEKLDYLESLVNNHGLLAGALADLNMTDQSVEQYQAALAILESLIQKYPQVPRYLDLRSTVLGGNGDVLWGCGRCADARPLYRRAREDLTKLAVEAPASAAAAGNLAWFLVACPDPNERDVVQAIEWAERGLKATPSHHDCECALGFAYYRQGDFGRALETLGKARTVNNGGDAYDWFGLAMTHRHLHEESEARKCFDRGCDWMARHNPRDAALCRLRAEAAEVLGLPDMPPE